MVIPQLFTDLSDLIAVRQNMLGIKARAEGVAPEAPAITYTELALWLAAFLGFLVAEAELVIRRNWLRPAWSRSASWRDCGGCIGQLPAEQYLAQGNMDIERRDESRSSNDEQETP